MPRTIERAGVRAAALAALMLAAPGGTVSGQEFAGREKLRAQSDEFRRDVIRMTEGVYVAVGYSASNVTLIQGDGGAIIVDTASDPVEARAVRAAFGDRLDAPVRAIVYTHGHPDHTGGAAVFAGHDNPDIYSHQLLVEGPPDLVRGMRDGGDQFGMTLPDSLYINAGVQLQYGRVTPPTREGYVRPTRTFSGDELSLTIAGIRLQLLHAPGETRENIAVWLPDQRVLMAGDDIYRAFPNLYPIRGGRLRPPEPWIASLERMLALGAEHLVPGHTRPIAGAANVRAALTAYRDGIQSVLDQTLAGMRKGERTDELVQHVKLPPPLADNPYLQELYVVSGQLDARGRYASTPTFLVVTDEEGPGHCQAERATGIYTWKRDGDTVRLTVVEDLCRWRPFAISLKPWRIRGARTEGAGRPPHGS